MTQKLYLLTVVVLFVCSAYGWGRLARPLVDRRMLVFQSLTAILGLAVLSFIGGVLNVLGLAKGPMVLALTGVGTIVTLRQLLRERPWRCRHLPLGSIPLFVAPPLVIGASLLLLPAGVFNIVDDFHMYITRAARMMETGSIRGNPFDFLGLDSLGSASFFHTFFWSAGGVEAVIGFDAVAGLALCLLFVAELTLRWRLPWWLGLGAMFAVVWINPQCVNISPVYSGAAGIMALILCGMLLARALASHEARTPWRLALGAGILAAWLASMKTTLGFFAAGFLLVLWLLIGLLSGRRRTALKASVGTALAGCVAVLPWALVSLPSLWQARVAGDGLQANAVLAGKYRSLLPHESRLLFDPIALLYGDTPVCYLAICGLALALGMAGLAQRLRCRGRSLHGMPAITAAGVAMAGVLFLNSELFPISMAIRYSCPVAIGGMLVVALGFVRSRTPVARPSRLWLSAVMTGACVVTIGMFNETFLERLDKAVRGESVLAYRVNHDYATYCRQALAPAQMAYHVSLQTNIPSGATALVWTATPFHFDFQRNHLLTLTVPGIGSPALRFPAGLPAQGLEDYLHNNGVQYVLVERSGYGVVGFNELARMQRSPYTLYQKLGDFGAYLRRSLDELASHRTILYSDDRVLIFKLGPDRSQVVSGTTSDFSL